MGNLSQLFIAVALALWVSAPSWGESRLTVGDVGLPASAPEWQLYQLDVQSRVFYYIPTGSEVADRHYVRWDPGFNQWVWVTGSDRRMILSGSKVHGARLGYTGQKGKNWYRLGGASHNQWDMVTDREWPETWRWDPAYGRMKTERYAAGWENLGGKLDPLPEPPKPPVDPPRPPVDPPRPPVDPPRPPVDPPNPPVTTVRCRITVTPGRITLGDSVILTMETEGPVSEATLDGAVVDFPRVRRRKQPESVGVQRVTGSVRGEGGESTCSAEFEVVAP